MNDVCEKCGGRGEYCWTCGETESHCECDARNIGRCDECGGTGKAHGAEAAK